MASQDGDRPGPFVAHLAELAHSRVAHPLVL